MLSIVIQYSTNEFKFLERNLEQSCKFADEVILVVCDRFFDGSAEDQGLMKATEWAVKRHPKSRMKVFKWGGDNPNPNYYHNLSRKIGSELASGDWILFLDADEILDDGFGPWCKSAMQQDLTYCLSCYWYFRRPEYRAKTLEGCGLLIQKRLCDWNLSLNLERQQFHGLANFKDSGLADGKPLAHHFSWVRTKEEMLNKVRKWGHKGDRNWVALVAEEFSRPFNGKDFVHGYEYEIVENKVFNSKNELAALINRYVQNPSDPETNFDLGVFYEDMGQTASALSYYLRTAERTQNRLLQFECMVRASMCFERQGCRNYTVKGLLQHALSLQPHRPEAYYLLSRLYEREKVWQDSYMIASVGDQVASKSLVDDEPLRTKVDYPGDYGLSFQKAVSSWWCGLCDESRDLFRHVLMNYSLDSSHMKSVITNLHFLKAFSFETYDKTQHDLLRLKFPGSNSIEKNYSEAFQDMFVLSVLKGKKNGTYFEIGAGDPSYGNNTFLLESQFGWKGVSLDVDQNFVDAHKKSRKNECLLKDASTVNYESFLKGLDFPNDIDYLQIDCDPPEMTYKILLTIPFETHRFAVITYEHDAYCDETKSFQEKSRKYLESYGYLMVVNNIAPDDFRSYEDWWVHPDLVDMDLVRSMSLIDDTTKKAKNYIMKG